MKLSEILRKPRRSSNSTTCTVTWEQDGFIEFDVDVEYDYVGASYSDHPYGSSYAREYHSASATELETKLAHDVEQLDDNDEKVIKTWPKGTNIESLPGWKDVKDSVTKQIDDAIQRQVELNSEAEAEDNAERHRSRYDDY